MQMHDRFLVLDAHSDMLNDVLPQRTLGRKNVIDEDWLPGMKKGGVDVRVGAIYSYIAYLPELALRRGLDLVAALYEEIDESSSLILCTTIDDVRQAKQDGKIGFILGLEGAEPLGRDIRLLRIFYALGLRVLGLTHAHRNYAGDGAFFLPTKTGQVGGLSDFGVRLVQEANELGVVIDVSHLNIPGFWDVMENTKVPVIASHSNCRALFDHPRGLWDDQIKAMAKNNGVIGINAAAVLVGEERNRTFARLIDHLDHIVNVGGVNSTGLGFDFCDWAFKYLSEEDKARMSDRSGGGTTLPSFSEDAEVTKVTEELVKRGYKDNDIELILGKNFLRVFEAAWK